VTEVLAEFRGFTVVCKSEDVKAQLEGMHPTMRHVLDDAVYCAVKLGWRLVLTCIYRTPTEDADLGGSGIHSTKPHRAVDIRTKDVDSRLVRDLEKYLDERWIYDPKRSKIPLCYTAPHGNAPHMHLQVCQATERR